MLRMPKKPTPYQHEINRGNERKEGIDKLIMTTQQPTHKHYQLTNTNNKYNNSINNIIMFKRSEKKIIER